MPQRNAASAKADYFSESERERQTLHSRSRTPKHSPSDTNRKLFHVKYFNSKTTPTAMEKSEPSTVDTVMIMMVDDGGESQTIIHKEVCEESNGR